MNGKIVETRNRHSSGEYELLFYPKKPPIEELEKAKKGTVCAVCDRNFAIPSEVRNIQSLGMCTSCKYALSIGSHMKYVILRRDPTLEEVLDRWDKNTSANVYDGLTYAEAKVLVQHIRS